jgi:Zn-dependent protease with chaperone function
MEMVMLLILFIVLLLAWLFGWAAFHVAGGLIHLLIILAAISLILHFVRGRRVRN